MNQSITYRGVKILTVQWMLLLVWLSMGMLLLLLQIRSYLQFIKPHQIPEKLVVSPSQPKETANLTEVCPAKAFVFGGIWWPLEATHYYFVNEVTICHAVVPEYNLHGNYFINYSRTTPDHTTRASCTNDSFPLQVYSYHGSIGYYSYYAMGVGAYCAKDNVAYIAMQVLGTFNMNGVYLAEDTGSLKSRVSYWYGIVGAIWLVYRILVIRRSFICCRLYGQKCAELGENLHLQEVMMFVQESMHLSAHGAANYQRLLLLYLIMEGIMTDLFLVIAHDGWAIRVQYISMGYDLSGLLLLLFEMVESTKLLKEKWRVRLKRVFFSYEATFVGELAAAFALQTFIWA